MSTWRQVLYPQVQLRVQVLQNCTRVVLEYSFQVLPPDLRQLRSLFLIELR